MPLSPTTRRSDDVAWLITGAAPKSWRSVYLAVGASVLSTVAAVIGVIALIQGGMSSKRIMRTATPSLVVGGINTTIRLVLLLAVRRSPWATLLIAGIA